jgi:hypothetical protein
LVPQLSLEMHTSWHLFHPFYTVYHCYREGQNRLRIILT